MPRVMVIEDSPTQAQQLAFVLEEAGFSVECAPDAERAFERLRAAQFDVILSDLHLPGDSGFDLCRRLKADPDLRSVPIVVCTSEADPLNVLRGLEAGADGFITKRRPDEDIVGAVRRVLARVSRDDPAVDHRRVHFLDQEFELTAGRTQLVDVLVSAFEDVVHLNKQSQANAAALRLANRQLEERNRELQRLADSERRAHEELKRAESQLVQAEKLSALGQMVAGVAHEINNPLAFVSNNLAVLSRDLGPLQDLLRDYQGADDALAALRPELLEQIRERAAACDLPYTLANLDGLLARTTAGLKRIQQIVSNLRDFARLDETDLKEADLNEGVRSTASLVHGRADEREVALALDLAPLPPVICYPAKINQVVLNLLANAIDACDRGDRVSVLTRAVGDEVELEIADTGSGIAPEHLDKIFDPFFTTKPQGQGTGLGLSITYGIVRAHGGRIDVETKAGAGTRFVVRLPRTPPTEPSL
ncbi:MAG: response regulator [Isosphaeraceae bacterium]|nr:response regulator [Isosphaeraceae bacterium]